MIDILAARIVMLDDEAFRNRTEADALYMTANEHGPVEEITFQIGPSHLDSGKGVTVKLDDLVRALREFDLTVQSR